MSIKSILVPLHGTGAGESSLALALELGQRLEARVSALHIALDPHATMPYLGEGMTAAMIDELVSSMEREAAARRARAASIFESACEKCGVSPTAGPKGPGFAARFIVLRGREDEIVADHGRVHDLVVLPAPAHDDLGEAPCVQAAIMDTGRPVLLTPSQLPETSATRIAVAWNGSIQAVRAVAASIDLMRSAEKVTVITVEENGQSGPSAEALAEYLNTHGILAEVKTMASAGMPVAEALLVEVGAIAADLMIMGAYTHSRVRELILGGVTRDILFELDLPVLMAH